MHKIKWKIREDEIIRREVWAIQKIQIQQQSSEKNLMLKLPKVSFMSQLYKLNHVRFKLYYIPNLYSIYPQEMH